MTLLRDNGDALIRREAARLYCRGQPCYAITDDNDIGTVYMFCNPWCVLPAHYKLGSMIVVHAPLRLALELTFVVVPGVHRCRHANLHPGPEGDRKVCYYSPAGRSTHRLQRVHAYGAAYGPERHGMSRCTGKRCVFPSPFAEQNPYPGP